MEKSISIWEVVKNLESKMSDKEKELGEARATMLLNYGDEGKTIKGLCDGRDTLIQMIFKVFSFYHDKLKKDKEDPA